MKSHGAGYANAPISFAASSNKGSVGGFRVVQSRCGFSLFYEEGSGLNSGESCLARLLRAVFATINKVILAGIDELFINLRQIPGL